MIVEHITDLIGNTPMLKISEAIHGIPNLTLYAKMEMLNPMGSVKDRIAWNMIKDDLASIKEEGKMIVENSSGNTAKALQAIASSHGIPFRLISAIAKVQETKDVLRLMGAEIEELANAASDCFDPNDPNDPQYYIQRVAADAKGKVYFPSQFTNERNVEAHYNGTGAEIIADLGSVDFLVGGMGTTGTTLGTSRRLKERNPDMKCIGICASKSDYIPGIRSLDQLWEAGLFSKAAYDDIISVTPGESLDAMAVLIRKAAILCGPSTGAIFIGLQTYFKAKPLSEPRTAVFIACDRVEPYLSYIKARRPNLLGQKTRAGSLADFQQRQLPIDANIVLPLEDAENWIGEKRPLIIDTRSNMAFKAICLPGSVNIPGDAFESMIDGNRPFSSEQPILLVCPVGEKSAHYASYLRLQGCDAYSLEMGLMGWRNYNLPLKMDEAA
jgi:cysteine synthase B